MGERSAEDDRIEAVLAYNDLQWCPECGTQMHWDSILCRTSCYLHGSFLRRGSEILWEFKGKAAGNQSKIA